MRNLGEGPRGGLMVWLMAVIVVSLAAKVDTTTADVVVFGLGLAVCPRHACAVVYGNAQKKTPTLVLSGSIANKLRQSNHNTQLVLVMVVTVEN